MELPIIPIGNSKGLRLPKTLLTKYQIRDKVAVEMKDSYLILRPVSSIPREGWETAFQQMHEAGDDQLLMDDVWEDEDWES